MYILASTSPRRKEILDKSKLEYKIITKEVDEIFPSEGISGEKIASVAYDKGIVVYNENKEDIVISADTGVVINNEILGKPKDNDDALEMLLKLNNNTHSVITGVAIFSKDKIITFYEESVITFKNNTLEELKEYVDTLEPIGKAGSYAIQGIGEKLVSSYKGNLDNIIGLPLTRLLKELNNLK